VLRGPDPVLRERYLWLPSPFLFVSASCYEWSCGWICAVTSSQTSEPPCRDYARSDPQIDPSMCDSGARWKRGRQTLINL
jgi:hypothetical protein